MNIKAIELKIANSGYTPWEDILMLQAEQLSIESTVSYRRGASN
jgi:hypothetical protein